ncbi:hypothetical protein BJ684DRAFT_17142 [Piptocephalis cylindrospora]|uniref:Mitochondrial splicing suppressor 51-like C-terminal domain-containing protein n=1 Tax=Piptocephalis cylindrospora TaxID=1907219 RepID=A0A4V1IXV3_9FUNG|nr:hypothetical protein BJ684DRAFT_17142 [Piptocephalis cylindrospora]|eukprot:RKP12359.1 hypothetical protein BJ684DRAFT_17142 [Piptocephalis cylindrospora]
MADEAIARLLKASVEFLPDRPKASSPLLGFGITSLRNPSLYTALQVIAGKDEPLALHLYQHSDDATLSEDPLRGFHQRPGGHFLRCQWAPLDQIPSHTRWIVEKRSDLHSPSGLYPLITHVCEANPLQKAQGQPFGLGQPHPTDFPLLTAALAVLPELFLALSSPSINTVLSLPVPPTILGAAHVVVTLTSAMQPHEDRTYACYIPTCRRRLREQERKDCQKKDWKSGHKQICPQAKAWMAREVKKDLPAFTFPIGIRAGGTRVWLEHQGIHNKGLWRRMCSCASSIPPGQLPTEEGEDQTGWALSADLLPTHDRSIPLKPNSRSIQGWDTYYTSRNIPFSSPISVLLSLPLSIYQGIHTLNILPSANSLSIVILDPVDILDTYPLFRELANVLPPSISLDLHLIGPNVPSTLADQERRLGSSSTTVHFHPPASLSELHSNEQLASAHMICLLDKDLGQAPSSWSSSLSSCLRLNKPIWVTERDELAATCSRGILNDLAKDVSTSSPLPVQLNPWRSPLYQEREEMALPTFDHAFTTGFPHAPF